MSETGNFSKFEQSEEGKQGGQSIEVLQRLAPYSEQVQTVQL